MRQNLIEKFKTELSSQKKVMSAFLSQNDDLHLGFLKVSYLIGKHRKPFTEGEFIKSVVLGVDPQNQLHIS